MECSFVLFFEPENTFCHFPRISASASFLLQGFFLRSVSKFRSIRTLHSWGSERDITPSDGPFLSHIFTRRNVPYENFTVCFGPKVFMLLREIELDFDGSTSWNTQPNSFEFINKATKPLQPIFFIFFVGLTVNLSLHEDAFFTESASWLCFVMLTFGMMPKSTWTDLCIFHWCGPARSFIYLSRGTTASESISFQRFFPSLWLCGFGAREDDCVACPRLLSSWRKLQAFPVVHCPFAFRWQHSPCFLSTLTGFP